jgi:hypothetical protein
MEHKKTVLSIAFIFFICSSGCSSLGELQIRRSVADNMFQSSLPDITLKINQGFKYIGETKHVAENQEMSNTMGLHEKNMQDTSYIFGQFDQDGTLTKGILMRLMILTGDPNQAVLYQPPKKESILNSGIEKILDNEYQSFVYTQNDLFTQEEKKLISQHPLPTCYLVKLLERKDGLGNKSRIALFYFENSASVCGDSPCEVCFKQGDLSNSQKQIMSAFIERSYASVRFIESRKAIDTTSRYVDTARKTQAQAKNEQDAATLKAGTIEQRLKELKDLYDKNLITKEDYEKKKADILNQL